MRFAFWITEETNAPGIFNTYCYSISTVLNAPDGLFFSLLLSISVHINSVFCVPCTVCDTVQQLSFRGNYSAVWDAVYLQYTSTDGAVSVTCTTRYRTHVHVRKYSVEMLYVILGKRL